jgi:Mg2+/Co2+ transporter CorB
MSLTELPASALLILVLILTAISAFFSGSETAMIGLNRYRLRHLVKQKHRGARKANRLLRRPDRLLGVILLGNNLANFTAASLATVIGLRLFGDAGVVSAPVLLTVFFLIFAEVAPKTIAARAPERLAFPAAHVLQPLLKFFYPGIVCINAIANFLVRPFLPNTSADEDNTLSVEELRTVVNEGAEIPGQGQNMLLGILDLEKVSVNDIMVPRSEIVGIDIDAEMSDVLQILANSQHTRLPIYKENINNILGLLHLRRVARYLPRKEREEDLTKAELMQLTSEPYYVPEGTPLHTQLFNFKKEKQRIALVVDEYGEIEGIVTLEDILEEIVGEFTTDFASKMPERLVLEHLETIPDSNLCLKIDGYLIETLHIKDNVIKNIKVTREARPAANPASDD